MSFFPSEPVFSDSILARRDPRGKILIALFVLAILVTLRRPELLGIAFVISMAHSRLARIAFSEILFLLFLSVSATLPAALWTTLVDDLSWQSLILLPLRAMTMTLIVAALIHSTSLSKLGVAAKSLGIPAPLIRIADSSYRYVFLIGKEAARLWVAMRLRGFRPRPSLATYGTLGAVTGALFVRGVERAETTTLAMRCRGFNGEFQSTEQHSINAGDFLYGAMMLILFTTLILMEYSITR